MLRPRAHRLVAFGLLALLVAALIPLTTGQANALCEDPTGGDVADQVEKGYDDHIVRVTKATLTPSAGDPVTLDRNGVHYLSAGTGTLRFDLEVANVGHGTGDPPGKLWVRVALAQPNGQGVVQNVEVDAPARGGTAPGGVTLDITQEGRHTVQFTVNPDRKTTTGADALEQCDDEGKPNPACPDKDGVPQPCTFTYYGNNTVAYGLLVGTRADLVVSQIAILGPSRATSAANPDSEVTVRATIQNVGTIPAYHLGSVTPGAKKVPVQITITGCTCTAATAEFGHLAPGAATTVEATLKAHGLAKQIEARAVADPPATATPNGVLDEADESNNGRSEVFLIPTPDLSVSATTDLATVDGRIVLPKGRPLEFTVNVQNSGDAMAASTDGGTFRVVASRDSPANNVLLQSLRLDAHSTVSYRVVEEAANLTGNHDYTITVDDQKNVLEANENNNQYVLRVTVALFDARLALTEAAANPTVPPGTQGRIAFELKNAGTVADTFTFAAPPQDQARVSYVDAAGRAIRDVALLPDKSFKGEVRYDIPPDAIKGDSFSTRLLATSEGSGNTTTRDLTFTVGDDTVAPDVSLHDPPKGYLSGNKVVIRVTDNVAVDRVETDITGSFQTVSPDTPGGNLYTVDVTGRPTSFKLNVRATDPAGNSVTEGFDLVRDTNAPRIASATFTPEEGATPGSKINLIVEARDENMDEVSVVIRQPRPGGPYTEEHTLVQTNVNFQLRDWIVPERPGHYLFNVTAKDRAGNSVHQEKALVVNGLDIRVAGSDRPIVAPRAPVAGENVRLTWRIQNTNPVFSTGPFFVALGVDREAVEGDAGIMSRQLVDLAPGEIRPITFVWPAVEGKTFFAFVVDERLHIAEDNENNNIVSLSTDLVFPEQPLFASTLAQDATLGFTDRLFDYWFVPTLFIACVVLFVIALTLGRRTVPS